MASVRVVFVGASHGYEQQSSSQWAAPSTGIGVAQQLSPATFLHSDMPEVRSALTGSATINLIGFLFLALSKI
jgi:hypothetical protein